MKTITIKALGGASISDADGARVRLRSRKHLGLLLYLATSERRIHSRSRLCELFWRSPPARARHSLSQALYDLKRQLGPVVRREATQDISLDMRSLSYDVDEFEASAKSGDLARAVDLYGGPFAENLIDAGTDEFERWQDSERLRLARLNEVILRRYVSDCEARGQWGEMCFAALRLAAAAPLDEEVHCTYMRALWHHGDVQSALRYYEDTAPRLEAELSTDATLRMGSLARRIESAEQTPSRTSPAVDREPTFTGREEEFGLLRKAVSGIDTGEITTVLIRGEAGIGKSRLVRELARSLTLEPVRLISSKCYQAEEDLPYSPIVDALAPLIEESLDDEPELREHFHNLAFLIPDFGPKNLTTQGGSILEPAAWRRKLYGEVAFFLSLMLERRPLVWVLEDIHWIDRASGSLLHYISRRLVDKPLLLILTVRDARSTEELPRLPVACPAELGPRVQSIHLGPMADEQIKKIVASSEPDSWDHPAAELAVKLSAGNPYYALEVLAAAAESIEWARAASSWDPLNDDRLRAVLGFRMKSFGPTGTRLLQGVSVLERYARPRLLSKVLNTELSRIAEIADDLYARRIIEDEEGRVAFTNDAMREFIYAEMTALQRAALHLSAARALEVEPDATPGVLATHFFHGDDWLRSFGYAMEAAQDAQKSGGHTEAARLAAMAARAAPGPEERKAALNIQAESSSAAGELAEAASCYQAVLRLASTSVVADARSALRLASVEIIRCKWESAARCLAQAREFILSVNSGDEKLALLATHSELALKLAFLSDDLDAARASEGPIKALVSEIRGGRQVSATTAFSVLSTKAIQEAVTGSSLRALDAITEAEEYLDGTTREDEIRYYSFRGYVRSRLAYWDAAEADLQRALRTAETAGDLLTTIRLWNNLACIATERGHWSTSIDRIAEAARLQGTLLERADTSLSIVLNRANLLFYQGLLAQAAEEYARAGHICRMDAIFGTQLEVHSCIGLIALQRGDLGEARLRWERVQTLRDEDGVLGGTQESFKYVWFSSWMSDSFPALAAAGHVEQERDVPSYAKLKWLGALLTDVESAELHEAKDVLRRLDMDWFVAFSSRWKRSAA